MIVSVNLSGGRVSVPVIDENPKTIWVSLLGGRIIKRHKRKHDVTKPLEIEVLEEEPIPMKLSWWRRLIQWVKGLLGGRS